MEQTESTSNPQPAVRNAVPAWSNASPRLVKWMIALCIGIMLVGSFMIAWALWSVRSPDGSTSSATLWVGVAAIAGSQWTAALLLIVRIAQERWSRSSSS